MKLTFKSNKSHIAAAFLDSFNTRVKARGNSIDKYAINISSEGRTSITINY